ncbi:MAG: chorismate lyase [Sulfuricaulis sp.]|nr:chorismate lyase [Sulfuricaulis sp.]
MSTLSTALHWRAEPLWRPVHRVIRSGVPEKYLPWLLDPASLTERIINHCRGNFYVRLLDQRRARPLRNEAEALDMRSGTRAIVRQVQLMCGDTPWVYARTIIPPQTIVRKSHRFTTLGARSLGAMLFADPSMKRGEVEIACLMPWDRLYQLATRELCDKPKMIWGRRSLFRVGGKPLLVCEFFLSAIADF